MFVCVCNSVTDKDIEAAVDGGVESMKELRDSTKLGTRCGKCVRYATMVLDDAIDEKIKSGQVYFTNAA